MACNDGIFPPGGKPLEYQDPKVGFLCETGSKGFWWITPLAGPTMLDW